MSAPSPLSSVLKRIRDMPLRPKPRPGERCELCAELLPDDHGHVVDLETRAMMCACRALTSASSASTCASSDRDLAMS